MVKPFNTITFEQSEFTHYLQFANVNIARASVIKLFNVQCSMLN